MTQPATPPELFDLPEALRVLLERAGYHGRLAIVGRADGRPLGDYDRRAVPALIHAAAPEADDGGPAREALVRTPDGGVAWSPKARAVVKSQSAAGGSKSGKARPKRAAAKRPAR